MTALGKDERQKVIEAAMERKFGKLLNWMRPEMLHQFGPNNLDDVDFFEKRLRETKDKVRNELESWPDAVIQSMADDLSEPTRIEKSDWSALAAKEINQLHRVQLPPIAFGFGHPYFATDFDYWGTMPELSLHEVSALSVGADPEAITDDDVAMLTKRQKKGVKLWSAHVCLLRYREFFRRHFHSTGWGYPPQSVKNIKRWIDEVSFEVHPLFYERLDERFPKTLPAREPIRKVELGKQERETLLKIIAAMACEQYGYDPRSERGEAPSRIRDDIEQIGQSMDPKTIRKWLKEASALVHKDYWSEGD